MIDILKTYNLRKKLNLIAHELGKPTDYLSYGNNQVYEDDRIVILCNPKENQRFKFIAVYLKTLKLSDDLTEVFSFAIAKPLFIETGNGKSILIFYI